MKAQRVVPPKVKPAKASQQVAPKPAKAKARRNKQSNGLAPFETGFASVAQSTIVNPGPPKFYRASRNEMRIVHCEKVCAVITTASTVFTVLRTIALNPGMSASFPWLSNEARGWEFYRFNRLKFTLIPSAPTSSAGNFMLAPDYDPADSAPVSEFAMSAYQDSKEAQIWRAMECDLTPDSMDGEMRRHFVRFGALAANQDIKTYDSGNLYVAALDGGGTVEARLWVEYDVSLFVPNVPSGGFFSTGTFLGATSLAAATPFGTAGTAAGSPVISASSLVLTVTNLVRGQEYALFVQLTGTVMSVLTVTLTNGATAVTAAKNSMVNAGATEIACFITFTASSAGPPVDEQTAVLTFTCTATTVTSSRTVLTVLAPAPGF